MLGGPKAPLPPLVWNSVSNLIFDTYCFWQFSWVLEIHQSAVISDKFIVYLVLDQLKVSKLNLVKFPLVIYLRLSE